jgi:hypothetical protein
MEGHEARSAGLERLDVLVGEWHLTASFPVALPNGADDASIRCEFEWALDGQFLVQRTAAPHPAPDSLAIISFDPQRSGYTQHYFDSRGVVRVYAMTLDDETWTLLRDSPDFSPLAFWQRFMGGFSRDRNTIEGRWETSTDEGASWVHDFDLNYSRIAPPNA